MALCNPFCCSSELKKSSFFWRYNLLFLFRSKTFYGKNKYKFAISNPYFSRYYFRSNKRSYSLGFAYFPSNKGKNKVTQKKPHSMVIFWIQLRRTCRHFAALKLTPREKIEFEVGHILIKTDVSFSSKQNNTRFKHFCEVSYELSRECLRNRRVP